MEFAFPLGNWVIVTKARKPQRAYKAVSKLCSHLLRHDTSICRRNDSGVSISVILNEMRIGAGGDSGRPRMCGMGTSSSRC